MKRISTLNSRINDQNINKSAEHKKNTPIFTNYSSMKCPQRCSLYPLILLCATCLTVWTLAISFSIHNEYLSTSQQHTSRVIKVMVDRRVNNETIVREVIRQGEIIPVPFRPLTSMRSLKNIVAFATIVTAGKSAMDDLREFVGSIHHHRDGEYSSPTIMVFCNGLKESDMQEIRLWGNVDAIPIADHFFPAQLANSDEALSVSYESLRLLAIEFACRKYTSVVFVDPGYTFTSGKGIIKVIQTLQRKKYLLSFDRNAIENDSGSPRGIRAFVYGTKVYNVFIKNELRFIRGYSYNHHYHAISRKVNQGTSNMYVKRSMDRFGVKPTLPFDKKSRTGFYCYINFRDDLMYNFQMLPDNATHGFAKSPEYRGRQHIGIGVPTASGHAKNVTQSSLIRHFLPTFIKSITKKEYQHFTFTLYIGYDVGDSIFDHEARQKEVMATMDTLFQGLPIQARMIRFPKSNAWLTYIWNHLYLRSMHSGDDYFYQVNDDLRIKTSGWATRFTDTLRKSNGFGVVGPNDPTWTCNMLTQAFVSRTHYDIFGYLYPIDIKDWYSDKYLTELYKDRKATFCFKDMQAENMREGGSRYAICNKPKWRQAIEHDRRTISAWLKDGSSMA